MTWIHSKHRKSKVPTVKRNTLTKQSRTTAKMVLKIHGTKGSTCTRRVLTALYEKNVPYELVPVDVANGEHKSPKYMALQPFGKVPAMDDDGFILFESRAIAKYIAKKYAGQGTPLLPAEGDLKAYGLFEQVNVSGKR
jgi:glutathione S-transferase